MPDFSFFELLSIIFLTQSGLYLFFLAKQLRVNFKLSDVFLFSFILVSTLIIINLFIRLRWLEGVVNVYYEGVALLAPLQFLYIESIINKEFKIDYRTLLKHSIGFFLIVGVRLVSIGIYNDPITLLNGKVFAFALSVFIYGYLISSILSIKKYHKIILSVQSNFGENHLKWLRHELMLLGILFAILGVEAIAPYLNIENIYETMIVVIFVDLLFLINVLTFRSLRSPFVADGISKEDHKLYPRIEKYASSSLTSEESRIKFKKVTTFFEEEKPYKNYNLSLSELAKSLDFSPVMISQIINQNSKMNFNDFVNHYRIEEAKRLLDKEDPELLIKEVMYESGFQSTSTFNSSFKKIMRCSPSAYRKQMKKGPKKNK